MSDSIVVSNLNKFYGSHQALSDVSFNVAENTITGFLGPNGAGKSTTMKILTGFMPPTSGQVTVKGLDVTTHPLEVKALTGYLPENNPLYQDMYVTEFLDFTGRLFGMDRKILKMRITEMIDKCGLEKEKKKKIQSLSKGYRQRVGLAQALLHDPKILILDEPTSGLDPNQLQQVRNLIKEIGESKTVILSTHIMQEVQAICEKIVLINDGKILVDSDLDSLLSKSMTSQRIVLETENDVDLEELKKLKGVVNVELSQEGKYLIDSEEDEKIKSRLAEWISSNGYGLMELKVEKTSMDEIFQNLTRNNSDD